MPIEPSLLQKIVDSVEEYMNSHKKEFMDNCYDPNDPFMVEKPKPYGDGEREELRSGALSKKDLFKR